MTEQIFDMSPDMKRLDGIRTCDLEQRDLPLESIIAIFGYIHGESGSEYHFMLGLDPRIQGVFAYCDDSFRKGSAEYLDVLKRMSSIVNSEINPETGKGMLSVPKDKKSLVTILDGIFDEFNVSEEHKSLVIDYASKI
ncbi:MAG: hypothetical protein AABW88_03695 [Nanoarchaeota archaeon]